MQGAHHILLAPSIFQFKKKLSIISRYNVCTFPVFSFSHILGPEVLGCWVLSLRTPSHLLKACDWRYKIQLSSQTTCWARIKWSSVPTPHKIRGGGPSQVRQEDLKLKLILRYIPWVTWDLTRKEVQMDTFANYQAFYSWCYFLFTVNVLTTPTPLGRVMFVLFCVKSFLFPLSFCQLSSVWGDFEESYYKYVVKNLSCECVCISTG